ncbi:hypothetical protein GE09DRAFT_1098476, partial [Coniochaeta sp. 2T2.1]
IPSNKRQAADCPLVCIPKQTCVTDPDHPELSYCVDPVPCAGFIGDLCLVGDKCVDDPTDDCDPNTGGADCIGICIPAVPGDF